MNIYLVVLDSSGAKYKGFLMPNPPGFTKFYREMAEEVIKTRLEKGDMEAPVTFNYIETDEESPELIWL